MICDLGLNFGLGIDVTQNRSRIPGERSWGPPGRPGASAQGFLASRGFHPYFGSEFFTTPPKYSEMLPIFLRKSLKSGITKFRSFFRFLRKKLSLKQWGQLFREPKKVFRSLKDRFGAIYLTKTLNSRPK